MQKTTTLSAKEGGKLEKTFLMKDFVALILAFEYRPIKYMKIIGAEHVERHGERINTYRVSVGKT